MATPNPIQTVAGTAGTVPVSAVVGDDLVLTHEDGDEFALYQVAADGTAARVGAPVWHGNYVAATMARVGPGMAVFQGWGMST